MIRKLSKVLLEIQKAAISATIPEGPPHTQGGEFEISATGAKSMKGPKWKSEQVKLQEELKEAGDEATKALREKQREMIDSLDLNKYVRSCYPSRFPCLNMSTD